VGASGSEAGKEYVLPTFSDPLNKKVTLSFESGFKKSFMKFD